MISKQLQESINAQINRELYSEYLYLAMSAWFAEQNLEGFANWMYVQSQEERFHAIKLYHYVIERGGQVILEQIDKPPSEFDNPLIAFEMTLQHEQFITDNINKLMDLAISVNDHAAKSFLQWYVDEQVEEEASADKLQKHLAMIKDNVHGILMLDRELATRTFTPPATTE